MNTSGLSVVDSLHDPNLLGGVPCFHDLTTWQPWLVFLKARDGLPLTTVEERFFCERTGRSNYDPPAGGYQTSVMQVGRQSGKSRVASAIVSHEAMTAVPEPDGTELYSLVIAQDARASLRGLMSYCKAPFRVVRNLVAMCHGPGTTHTRPLANGCVIAAYPCRPDAVRGLRGQSVVLDELAFFRSSDNYPMDVEMLRAVRPTMATTGGRLTILSSPYGESGQLWELHRRYFGRDDAPVLFWMATAPQMNPTLRADYLERMREEDPEAYASEVLGEFRSGVSNLFDSDAIDDVVMRNERERRPEPGVSYEAGVDAASGTGKDAFTAAVAHRGSDGVAVLDALRVWQPPFQPEGVIAEASAFVRTYGCHHVHGDAYAPGFVEAAFQRRNVSYQRTDKTRSEFFLELLPLVNSRQARLLDIPELLSELRGLVRTRGTSGRDRVDHRRGSHDDRANSAAIALVEAAPSAGGRGWVVRVSGW